MTENCNDEAIKLCEFLENFVPFKECKPLFKGADMFKIMLLKLQR